MGPAILSAKAPSILAAPILVGPRGHREPAWRGSPLAHSDCLLCGGERLQNSKGVEDDVHGLF